MILADLDNNYSFPAHIALTQLRPDVVLFSNSLKQVILIELTSPCEENMNTWHINKLNKYNSLVKTIEMNKWHVNLFAIEVGARGYVSTSVSSCFKRLGLPKNESKNVINTLGRIAMECSFYIWLCRNTRVWNTLVVDSEPCKPKSVLPEKEKSEIKKNNLVLTIERIFCSLLIF